MGPQGRRPLVERGFQRASTGWRCHRGRCLSQRIPRWASTIAAEVAPAPDVVRVLVLGPLAVEHNGRPLHVAGTHRRRLLAFLVSRVGQAVGVDAIVDALWGEDPPPTATRTIQSHVARLRGSFAGVDRELIETTAGGYRLAARPVRRRRDGVRAACR